jgi:hypothetical protein
MDPTAPARFLGVLALELRDGAPPAHAALDAAAAGELAVQLGEALAALAPAVRDADLAVLGAHFDPAEALRPGWPLHQRALELLRHAPQQTAPRQAQGGRVVGFGADANGGVPMPLQCDLDLVGGGLRVLPFVLHGDGVVEAIAVLEAELLDRGMASAATALALQDGLGAALEHVRILSLHDLLAMTALQYRNVGLDPAWALLETALLEPTAETWLDAPPEPLARYVEGEVRIALLDPPAWQKRNASAETDAARLLRGFERFQARQRQLAAVLGAHGVPVTFVHCADADAGCLR